MIATWMNFCGKNKRRARKLFSASMQILKWLLRFALFSVLAVPLFATFGIAVMTDGFVVVGIDSQVSGVMRQLECKMSHNANAIIVSSGTYRFYPQVDRTMFSILEAEADTLKHQDSSIAETFSRFDKAIQPRYREALTDYFFRKPFAYLDRYGESPVAELIVAGSDTNGPWLGNLVYQAPTPPTFRESIERKAKPSTGQIRIATVPREPLTDLAPEDYWKYKLSPGQNPEAIVASRVNGFMRLAALRHADLISEPFVIAIVDSNGFRFLNKGTCGGQAVNRKQKSRSK
jgi:hypothetical protein